MDRRASLDDGEEKILDPTGRPTRSQHHITSLVNVTLFVLIIVSQEIRSVLRAEYKE
jgi:hypothetical protein